MKKLEIQYVLISDIKEYKHNVKQHPQWQIDRIIKSIENFGFNDPIAIDENNTIIEGHGRYLASKQMGKKRVPCIVLDNLSESQKKAYIIAHNKLNMDTGFDMKALQQEIESIKDSDIDLDFIQVDFGDIEYQSVKKDKKYDKQFFTQAEIKKQMIKDFPHYDTVEDLVAEIIDYPSAMYQFNRLCQGFNEGYNISLLFNPHRLDTETIKNKSIFYAINNDKTYARELSRYIADVQNKIPVGTQYYKFFGIGSGGYQYVNEFQPYLARDIYKMYCDNNSKILDPCAGWGGRMIGFASCMFENAKYFGVDPAVKTFKGLKKLREFLRQEDSVKLSNTCFEDTDVPEDYFDFCFTSPPYFNTEHYDGKKSSFKMYGQYESWRDNFLFVMLDKIVLALKDNAPCLLNVGDKHYTISDDIIEYLSREYKIKAYRVNQFKIGGSGIGKRSGTKDHDGEPFILFYKKVK